MTILHYYITVDHIIMLYYVILCYSILYVIILYHIISYYSAPESSLDTSRVTRVTHVTLSYTIYVCAADIMARREASNLA